MICHIGTIKIKDLMWYTKEVPINCHLGTLIKCKGYKEVVIVLLDSIYSNDLSLSSSAKVAFHFIKLENKIVSTIHNFSHKPVHPGSIK